MEIKSNPIFWLDNYMAAMMMVMMMIFGCQYNGFL
jgi:hypothetical protein